MNAPSPIPVKVRRIVPLLGSASDGEALGACRAIRRTLEAVSLDFHALAHAIRVEGEEPKPNENPWRPARHGPDHCNGWRQAWAENQKRRHFTPRQEAAQLRQVGFCLRNLDRLGRRERAFIQSIARSANGLSVAQADWLADIADRLDQEVSAA